MEIDVVMGPDEIGRMRRRGLGDAVCVVFDVLRATSSICTALAHGCREVHPVLTVPEARALARRLGGAVLGGERGGERIRGFDLGNSPSEYAGAAPKRLVVTTTNGTVAMRACAAAGAGEVWVGSLLNLDAVAARVGRVGPARLVLVCAGTHAELALEDVYAAGVLASRFRSSARSDAAEVACAVAGRRGEGALDVLLRSRNGRALVAKGRRGDVEWCARLSVYDVMGRMEGGVVRPAE